MAHIPLTEAIVHAVAKLLDDSSSEDALREPSHQDIDFIVQASGLGPHDPRHEVGSRAQRIRALLGATLATDAELGAKFVEGLLAMLRACGAFRPDSRNFSGRLAIEQARAVFASVGFELGSDGSLTPLPHAPNRHTSGDAP